MSQKRHVSAGDTATLPRISASKGSSNYWIEAFFGPGSPFCTCIDRPIRIGRDPTNEIVIDDVATSRTHAELRVHDNRVLIRDLESRNGTFVGGRAIHLIELEDDAILRVGETLFRISRRNEPWVPPSGAPLVGGSSLAMLRRKIGLVGPTNLAVLVLGETGTGKDVIARLIHDASKRSGAFIAVNCAALPESLVEAELFGHVKGAFSGAAHARKGLFSAAAGGTLFLDEIGDLPPSAQAKLLRVLEDGEVRPVGSERAHRVDVRVISATNRELGTRGDFRTDLLARLGAVEMRTVPLRARPEDIPALAIHLLSRAGHSGVSLDTNAIEALALYRWPMNVRELDAALRFAALTNQERIGLVDLPEHVRAALPRMREDVRVSSIPPDRHSASEVERVLREYRGNIRQACRALGISRGHFYRLLKRWNLEPSSFRKEPSDERHADC